MDYDLQYFKRSLRSLHPSEINGIRDMLENNPSKKNEMLEVVNSYVKNRYSNHVWEEDRTILNDDLNVLFSKLCMTSLLEKTTTEYLLEIFSSLSQYEEESLISEDASVVAVEQPVDRPAVYLLRGSSLPLGTLDLGIAATKTLMYKFATMGRGKIEPINEITKFSGKSGSAYLGLTVGDLKAGAYYVEPLPQQSPFTIPPDLDSIQSTKAKITSVRKLQS